MPQVDIDKRVLLSSIQTLTLFGDGYTHSRRTRPIPQLTCKGSICKLYKPYSVMCTNIGGRGINVNWKCEADLPDTIRFRKVDVNCEGWSRARDPFVLEGSCGLTYELTTLPSTLGKTTSFYDSAFRLILILLTIIVLLAIYFRVFERRGSNSSSSSRPSWGSSWWPASGSGAPGGPPPPPYSNEAPTSSHEKRPEDPTWRPGFWSGLGMGSVASYLWSNRNQRNRTRPDTSQAYDWEQPHSAGSHGANQGQSSSFQTRFSSSDEGMWSGPRARATDQGEGSSNLGQTRKASAFARSNVR